MLPILSLTLCYVAGILAESVSETGILSSSILAGGAFLVAAAMRKPLALHVFMFAFGLFNLATQIAIISPFDLRKVAGSEPGIATVRGTLVETPSERISIQDGQSRTRFLAKLRVSSLGTNFAGSPAAGTIVVTTPGKLDPNFYGGRTVEVTGLLKRPDGPAAPNLFDYRDYLRWHRIHFLLQAESTNDWNVLDLEHPPKRPMADAFLSWAQRTLAAGLPGEDDSLRLLWAMALGWTTTLNGEIAEPFMRTGTLHIFAISGLHITLISYILVQLLQVFRLPRWLAGLLAIPLIWFYTAATGWQPSAIRSTIMSTVVIGGWILQRPGHLLNSLGMSALIILIWEPQQLFQASFQLSFFVVLSLAVLAPYNKILGDLLWRGDPFLPEEMQWQKRVRRSFRIVSASLATTFSAWLGSMPLIAHYFAMVTPGSLLANLIIVPLSSLALMSCTASLIAGAVWLPAAEIFNHASWFLMKCMIVLCERMQNWPAAYFYVPMPNLWQCVALYSILLGAVLVIFHKRRIGYPIAILPLAVLAAFAWMQHQRTDITILPTSGATIFVDAPGRAQDFLIDFSDARSVSSIVRPFLHAQGAGTVRKTVSTMGDVRHVSGAPAFLNDFGSKEIWKSPASFRSSAYREFLDDLDQAGIRVRQVSAGDKVGPWRVLHPRAGDKFGKGADQALVLQANVNGVRILLLSGLGKAGQAELLDRSSDLQTDIVIAGMTGNADEPLQNTLLRALAPKVIVIANLEHPVMLRGTQRFRERISATRIPVFYTADSGAVVIESAPRITWVRDLNGRQVQIK